MYMIFSYTHVCVYAGKAPVTWGGKILLISHWFFVTIVAATYTGIGFRLSGLGLDTCIPISICISISLSYTGAVGAFLAFSSDAPIVEGYHSLQGGLFGVVVPGPAWNSFSKVTIYIVLLLI